MDFKEVEEKWQRKWFGEKVFEPEVKKQKKKFFLTVPYPYVSGPLHVGHGRTYVNGDIIARFKRMRGYNTLWPMAFHVTGTPVLAIADKIKKKDAETVELYKKYVGYYISNKEEIEKIVESFSEPWNIVKFFSEKIVNDFKNMGFSLDLSRQFTTGDKEYNKFIEWQFKKYKEKNYIKREKYPILYCLNCRNAVGEDDIQGGDTNPVELQKFFAFKSKLEGDDAYIISSTLRPETVFGITNMFVNANVEYVKVRVEKEGKKEKWWVSKEAIEKLEKQGWKIKIIKEVKGSEFVRKYCIDPNGRKIIILPGNFVDPDNASGFVHSVPSDAPFDHAAIEELKNNEKKLKKYGLKKEQLEFEYIPLIESKKYGKLPAVEICKKYNIKSTSQKEALEKATAELYKDEFYNGKMNKNCGKFKGMSVREAKEKVGEWLVKNGKAEYFYETSRKARCRCGGKIVGAILPDQWFLDFNSNGWKEKAYNCLDKMTIYPKKYRKQFKDVFEWLDKRPCARKRGIGTELPFEKGWIIESLSDSTIYMAFYTIIKNIRKFGIKPEQLTPEFFDYVFLGKGEPKKISEKTKIPEGAIEKIKEEFEYWYPNDLRHTAISHISNHLSFFIFAHAAIFRERDWPRAITLNDMLIREGAKMSKSKGNVISLVDVKREYGADLFRLYMGGAADFESVLDFRARDIESTKRRLMRFWNIANQLIENRKKEKKEGRNSKWIISRMQGIIEKSTSSLESFRIREYIQIAFYTAINEVEEFLKKASDEEVAYAADGLFEKWVKLLAPVIPHLCEELWERYGKKNYVSLEQWPEADKKLINKKIEREQEFVDKIVSDVRSIIKITTIEPKHLKIIVASESKWEQLTESIDKADDVGEIKKYCENKKLVAFIAKRFYEFKEKGVEKIDEYKIVNEYSGFIKSELNLEKVDVEKEEESREEKAEKAMPTKPSLIIK